MLWCKKKLSEVLSKLKSRGFRATSLSTSRIYFKIQCILKSHLHQGLSEPEIYGDLVHKFKKMMGRNDFYDQFQR